MAKRIYLVTDTLEDTHYLVRAGSQKEALKSIAGPRFTVEIPTQEQLVNAVSLGTLVTDIGEAGE